MKRLSEIRKKGIAVFMAVTLAAASFTTGCGNINVADKTVASASESRDDEKLLENSLTEKLHSSSAGKTETVYIIKNADGENSETIVSEWLKNPDGKASLSDVSELKDIEVVKGNATYTDMGGGKIEWNTDGSDVYYRGSTDKELPVDVELSYKLDGKEVKASELEGASGHLEITFNYRNNTLLFLFDYLSIIIPFSIFCKLKDNCVLFL